MVVRYSENKQIVPSAEALEFTLLLHTSRVCGRQEASLRKNCLCKIISNMSYHAIFLVPLVIQPVVQAHFIRNSVVPNLAKTCSPYNIFQNRFHVVHLFNLSNFLHINLMYSKIMTSTIPFSNGSRMIASYGQRRVAVFFFSLFQTRLKQ